MHNVHKLCKNRAKNEFLGQFHVFGSWDRHDVAYFDRTKLSERFGDSVTHAGSFKNQEIECLNDIEWPKMRFSTSSSTLVGSVALMLHVLILPNVLNDSVSLVHSLCSLHTVCSLPTDVEHARLVRYSSQRQLRSGF